ncbi:FHA domain-containing protein [Sphingobacterium sp. BIGb0165]|uniref:FHA domain-containing protein n=1 Tax=Sphingobacterium sp. BIGb0165 TaxID=2940615 RepID=UPI002167ADB3|nr:FHA domain-containing protein [Sphingobacterium sp. BIGb0165]MCS4226593.1 hypothetical protein [Sphingobacterium sp. BIGb0165]
MNNLTAYLDFLELPSNATHEMILQRVQEKEHLFAQLLSNAPNDYLKNIHTRNINKLEEIKTLINQGYIARQGEQSANKSYAPPKCSSIQANDDIRTGQTTKTAAWLIRHTENRPPKSFPLFSGKNFIGRISSHQQHEILIDDDIYISRSHAFIEVKNDSCMIVDQGSKNGTYINGRDQRISSSPLKDSDTIQLGNTKFVFKTEIHKTIDHLVDEVDRSEYMKTIVIDIL